MTRWIHLIFAAVLTTLLPSQAIATPVNTDLAVTSPSAYTAKLEIFLPHPMNEQIASTKNPTIFESNDEYGFNNVVLSARLSIYKDNDPFTLHNALSFGPTEYSSLNGPATSPVSEPATMLLFASGIASLAGWKRRKSNKSSPRPTSTRRA